MEISLSRLPKEEQVTLTLGSVFEQRGYRRYQMSNFETYDMYLANKSFLESEGVITFTDASGRLMALKPDVTMSIVKNTKQNDTSNKLYYIESVFRSVEHGSNYREIPQMGVEYIGAKSAYAEAEVAELAVRSLEAISKDCILNISHMGFITGLLNSMNIPDDLRGDIVKSISGKNEHGVIAAASAAGCTEQQAQTLSGLVQLSGRFKSTLKKAENLVENDEMKTSLAALKSLYLALCEAKADDNVRLDFSIINDLDYYNGLIFRGYVKGVPHCVLSGGRYDKLMRRFSKPQCAVGFALYLDELGRAYADKRQYDVDTLLLYNENALSQTVMTAVQYLMKTVPSVRAETQLPQNLRFRRLLVLNEDGTVTEKEVVKC